MSPSTKDPCLHRYWLSPCMYQAGQHLSGEAAPSETIDSRLWDLQSLPSVPDVLLPLDGLAPGELLHCLKLGLDRSVHY